VFQSQVNFVNDPTALKTPPFSFPADQQQKPLVLLMSNHYLLVSTGSSLWLSNDGGVFFIRCGSLFLNVAMLQSIFFSTRSYNSSFWIL